MAKAASITHGLVTKKGEAAPSLGAHDSAVASPKHATEKAADYYKALTVKLDRQRYIALKNAGVRDDKKSQEIFVEALDLWLKQNSQ
ncbi:MAG: hypothetical protein KDI50_01405 [Candidatus Competibacteraceae bacterium]|nr:hypothetical protein [Candidatus Competibacteraceae bacterium]